MYGRYANQGKSDAATFAQPRDSKRTEEGGFRSDWNLTPRDLLTVQGEIRLVDGGQTITGVVAQVPPVTVAEALHRAIAEPPSTEIFFSCPCAKNATHWPSGEKNGPVAPRVTGS